MLLLLLLFSLSEPVHRSTVQLFDLGVNLGKLQWVFEKHRGGDSSVCVCVWLCVCGSDRGIFAQLVCTVCCIRST